MAFPRLRHPIVLAPLAGGPSTPELAAAVTNAGGLGFLGAGYLSADDVRARIAATRALTDGATGVNLFVLRETAVDEAAIAAYAVRVGGDPATARFDEDAFDAKLDVVVEERVPVVSFAFGCPDRDVFERLHAAELEVWVTVTEPDEAVAARDAGADALVLQGVEAGGHRGTWDDRDGRGELALLPLLRLVAREVDLPLVAAGGIADGAAVAAVLDAGARAAQIGTAFLRCPEAGTADAHRGALAGTRPTRITRAFTGRRARGIANRFMDANDAAAPSGYPQVNQVTAPLRAAARAAGDAESINLWAGEAYALARDEPAADVVARLAEEARVAGARRRGVDLFNRTWALLRLEERTAEQDDELVHAAHASAYHWSTASECRPENRARSEWQLARVYAVLGRAEPALHHARRCLALCEEHGVADWDLAFAHEALARAARVAGDDAEAARETALARAVPVADAEDRELLEEDLATI